MVFPFQIVTNDPQLYRFYVVITNLCVVHFLDFVSDPHYHFQLM